MTSIDATVHVEPVLAEEYLDAVIEDGETYVSKLSEPKIVIITPQYADTTVIPTARISGRTITFGLEDASQLEENGGVVSTVFPTGAHGSPAGYHILIKGRR